MQKWLIIFSLPFLLFCTGCSQYWYQPDNTFDQCKQDRLECFEQLKKRTDFGYATVDYEVDFIKNCMTEKGYQLVAQDQLPLNAKRHEPAKSLHWRTNGIAGKIE